MASFVSGQDESNPALWLATRAGKMELSCPLGTTRRVPQEKIPQKSCNKSFIGQVCSVKMAGYWPRSFFCEFMDLNSVPVHEHAKKELGQYPAILTKQAWSITDVYLRFKPRKSHWKIPYEQKCSLSFSTLVQSTGKFCSIRPRKFPEIYAGIFGQMESAPVQLLRFQWVVMNIL